MRMILLFASALAAIPVAAHAQSDPSARWTGFYAGSDLGGANGTSTSSAPCHVGCGNGGTPSYGAHSGYGADLGSGLVGGVEADVNRSGR